MLKSMKDDAVERLLEIVNTEKMRDIPFAEKGFARSMPVGKSIREIGENLYAEGGLALMVAVHTEVSCSQQYPPLFMRDIDFCWSEVGGEDGWQS